MKRILAITVGGSPQPIVRSIIDRSPDQVLFFVTTKPQGGSRRQVLEKIDGQESIVARAGLAESAYELVPLEDSDDLDSCYSTMKEAMERVSKELPESECIADYTGGTKTMSAALVLSATQLGWKLSLVRGERTNLIKALDGTEIAQLVRAGPLYLEQAFTKTAAFFDLFQYESVELLLRAALDENPVSGTTADRVRHAISLARAFGAWDRFEHETAFDLLRIFHDRLSSYVDALVKLLGKSQTTHYERVWDLVRNAERRAEQGHYDDAVLRLYRALELFAQIRLEQEYELNTENLDLSKLPHSARRMFAWQKDQGRKRITAGLFDAYRLLSVLDDPVGTLYEEEWANPIKDVLERRNRSILAHGTQPVGKKIWEKAYDTVNGFLTAAAAKIGVPSDWPQFPPWEEVKKVL